MISNDPALEELFFKLYHVRLTDALGNFDENERQIIKQSGDRVIESNYRGVCGRDYVHIGLSEAPQEADEANRRTLGIR